jgi:hypothetical protein
LTRWACIHGHRLSLPLAARPPPALARRRTCVFRSVGGSSCRSPCKPGSRGPLDSLLPA